MPIRILKEKLRRKNLGARGGNVPVPYSETEKNFDIDESPIRTAYPVSTVPPSVPQRPTRQPPSKPTGHASGTMHDPLCQTDLRRTIDTYIK